MNFEQYIRDNLDGTINGAGRPLTEYRLRVEQLAGGAVVALHLVPDGFGEDKGRVLGLAGDLVSAPESITAQVKAIAEQRELERVRLDEEHAAAVQKQYDNQVAVEAQAERERAEEAARMRPLDIAAGTTDPAP